MAKERLSKVLARSGVASRRKCEEIIFAGQVKINGEVAQKPETHVDLKKDVIHVQGERVQAFEKKVYYIFNKPAGYVCTNSKESNKKIVIDFFPAKERLFTVGRLDKETMGLLIVTNDGQLAHQVTHPSFEVEKEYLVKTDRDMSALDLKRISLGTRIEGVHVTPVSVQKVRKGTLKIVVKEGKKHEVRRLVGQTGAEILELTRIRIGNLRLGQQELGSFQKITLHELQNKLEIRKS